MYLYKDFQWEIIFKVLSKEKHFNLFIDKDKQTIDNVDEKVVDNILTKKYMKGDNLDVLKSMFNMVLLHHVDNPETDELKLPHLDNSIINLLNSFRLASLKDTSEGYALLSNFKSINDMVVIKTAKEKSDNYDILYEYFIGSIGINKLRNLIPNFAYTLAIFKCNPLPIDIDKNIDINKFCETDKEDSRFYVVYEKIPGISLSEFVKRMKTLEDTKRLVSYIIQICFSLQIAQQEINFTHYDLHSENIILRQLDEPIAIEYNINNKIYKIETNAIPTIIDYGFSHFTHQGVQFGMTDMPSLGINPTKTSKGYDLYKLLMFILNFVYQEDRKRKTGLFGRISWILNYFNGKEDPYGIHDAYKTSQWDKLTQTFDSGWKNYFAVIPSNKKIYDAEPIEFIRWIQSVYPSIWKDFIKVSDTEYNEPQNRISTEYTAKLEGRRIFRTDLIDEIKDCEILETDHKSYIINKYIATEFRNILDQFGEYIKDKDVLLKKIIKLERQSKKYKSKYTKNDQDLLQLYTNELVNISSSIELNDYHLRVKNIKEITDIKRLNPKIEQLMSYNKIYLNYKMFIDYSRTRSIGNRASDDDTEYNEDINIDKELEAFYYASKKLYIEFSSIKSEYIFDTLRKNLEIINKTIYDFKNKINISPMDWDVTDKFLKSLRIVQYVLSDIRIFYPDVLYACKTMENFIFKLADSLSEHHNIFIYVFTRSKNQIKLAFNCDSDSLVNLVMNSMKQDISYDFVKNFIAESLDRNKNDEEIYKALIQYANITPKMQGINRRAQSRVRDLNFMYSYIPFQLMKKQRDFTYLDLGGDGSITSAIGSYLELEKDNIINADVDDWLDKGLSEKGNYDITYITINKTGRLPFSDNKFSLVTAFQVLHRIEDIDNRLQELYRIIKPGGFLLIREHDVNNECTQLLADIEHSLYEMVLNNKLDDKTEDKLEDNLELPEHNVFLENYQAFYRSSDEWTKMLKIYGFEYIKNINQRLSDVKRYNNTRGVGRDAYISESKSDKNPTRSYYVMYRKK